MAKIQDINAELQELLNAGILPEAKNGSGVDFEACKPFKDNKNPKRNRDGVWFIVQNTKTGTMPCVINAIHITQYLARKDWRVEHTPDRTIPKGFCPVYDEMEAKAKKDAEASKLDAELYRKRDMVKKAQELKVLSSLEKSLAMESAPEPVVESEMDIIPTGKKKKTK